MNKLAAYDLLLSDHPLWMEKSALSPNFVERAISNRIKNINTLPSSSLRTTAQDQTHNQLWRLRDQAERASGDLREQAQAALTGPGGMRNRIQKASALENRGLGYERLRSSIKHGIGSLHRSVM